MRARAIKTTTALALAAFLLAACSDQVPGNQQVPSDQDPSSTSSPSAPQAEEGDLAVPLKAEGSEEENPILSGEDIATMEGDPGDVVTESDGKLTGLDAYFNYVPSEVEIPQEVVDAFPQHHGGLAEQTLAYILGSNVVVDLHQEEVTEETFRLSYRGMETYLSEPLIALTEENVDAYLEAGSAEEMAPSFTTLWGVAPLHPKFSGWEDPRTGEAAEVDHTREWDTRVDSFAITGLQQGESKVDGVSVQFNRGVEIPTVNPDYDIRVYQGFNLTMIPGMEENEWVVDSFHYETHTIEEIEELP